MTKSIKQFPIAVAFWFFLFPALLAAQQISPTKAAEAKPASESFQLKKRTPTVAILPFTNTNDDSRASGFGESVASMLHTHLRNETNFVVLERSRLNGIIDETALAQLGITKENRNKLKSLYSVEVLLTGDVSHIGDLIQIDCRLISVKTGKVVVAEFAEVSKIGDLRNAVSQLAKTIELKYLRQWMGSIVITTAPVEGEIYLDDTYISKASLMKPLKITKLLEGAYRLRVLASGYSVYEEIIPVAPKSIRELHVILKSLPGSLKIVSDPPGADVQLNGKSRGSTPLTVKSIREGKYEITLSMKDFQNWSQSVHVRPGQLSEIKGFLEVIPGKAEINSSPTGAMILFGGKKVGASPVLLENLKPGTYELEVRYPNYQTHKERILIRPGEKSKLHSNLKKKKGKLTVVGNLADTEAILYRDDKLITKKALPLHKIPLDIGTYTLKVEKPTYYPVLQKINIKAFRETRIELMLEEKPGILSVGKGRNTPADVYVDGEYMGKTAGYSKELDRGDHEVVVDNYFGSKTLDVEMLPDKTTIIEAEERPRLSKRWLVPISMVAVILYLFNDGGKW